MTIILKDQEFAHLVSKLVHQDEHHVHSEPKWSCRACIAVQEAVRLALTPTE